MKCLIIDYDLRSSKMTTSYLNKIKGLELVGTFDNCLDAITVINENSIDLVIVDIELYYKNRIDLNKHSKNVMQYIFISNTDKLNIEAFKLNATDYLKKPIAFQCFWKAISKAKLRYKQTLNCSVNMYSAGHEYSDENNEVLSIKTDSEIVEMKVFDIKYVQTSKGVTKIYKKNAYGPIITLVNLENILMDLPDYFLQVHKDFIINTCLIKAVQKRKIIIDEMQIPLGLEYQNRIVKHLKI